MRSWQRPAMGSCIALRSRNEEEDEYEFKNWIYCVAKPRSALQAMIASSDRHKGWHTIELLSHNIYTYSKVLLTANIINKTLKTSMTASKTCVLFTKWVKLYEVTIWLFFEQMFTKKNNKGILWTGEAKLAVKKLPPSLSALPKVEKEEGVSKTVQHGSLGCS